MQTPRGEHESACKGPEDGVLGRLQEPDVPGAESTGESRGRWGERARGSSRAL